MPMSTTTNKRPTNEYAQRKEQLLKLCAPHAHKNSDTHKAQLIPVLRPWLAQMREAIHQEFLTHGKPITMLSQHTQMFDVLLSVLLELSAHKNPMPLALVAIGGYGRTEQFPYSDLDVLFLTESSDNSAASSTAEWILYILWDLGLKVGQAHRTVEDCITQSKTDFSIRTTLLDARFIDGKKNALRHSNHAFQ